MLPGEAPGMGRGSSCMRRHGMRRIVRRITTVASFGLASLALFSTASAGWGMPRGVTDEARQIADLYVFTLALAVLVFIGVVGALLFAIVRYRRRSDDEMPPQFHGSTVIEAIWIGIPVAIVLALFTYSFIVLQDIQEDADPEDMSVEIRGFQFGWQFTYDVNDLGQFSDPASDEQIVILGSAPDFPELVLPVDERVEFRLVADDVIHSFYVRDFNFKLDLIPGRDNRFAVTLRETGVFNGYCAELCGVDHALMRFTVRVVEQNEFAEWIADQVGDDAAVRQP